MSPHRQVYLLNTAATLKLAGTKAVLSHLIDHFPAGTKFILQLGERASDVQTYLELAHPKLNVEFAPPTDLAPTVLQNTFTVVDGANPWDSQIIMPSKPAFDFSKPGEDVYLLGDRVLKYFQDPVIASRRVERAKMFPSVFPKMILERENWYSYEWAEGKTLYEFNSPEILDRLLNWLETNLWKPVEIQSEVAFSAGLEFYREKTKSRVDQYHEKNQIHDTARTINGEQVEPVFEMLARVPWAETAQIKPVFFHGDLQFDNVVLDPVKQEFLLLDWRQDFAGHVNFGDLYYDYAKMLGGIELNYDLIKRGRFHYHEDHLGIEFEYPSMTGGENYKQSLSRSIERSGCDPRRVRLLTALIYLNMSPLHQAPLDRMLYALGSLRLHHWLNKEA